MTATYSQSPNKLISAANGIDYAYRETGEGPVPLVLLQHFRGNLDNWDPALIDALAPARRVITFDNAGVGGSSGTTPPTVAMTRHAGRGLLRAGHPPHPAAAGRGNPGRLRQRCQRDRPLPRPGRLRGRRTARHPGARAPAPGDRRTSIRNLLSRHALPPSSDAGA